MLDKNNKEAIQLLIDTHNETNEDALRLISEHYFDIKDSVKTKIYGISEREISFLLTMPTKKIYRTIRFPREVKSSNEISTFFIKILNQAREKAHKNYPKIEIPCFLFDIQFFFMVDVGYLFVTCLGILHFANIHKYILCLKVEDYSQIS